MKIQNGILEVSELETIEIIGGDAQGTGAAISQLTNMAVTTAFLGHMVDNKLVGKTAYANFAESAMWKGISNFGTRVMSYFKPAALAV